VYTAALISFFPLRSVTKDIKNSAFTNKEMKKLQNIIKKETKGRKGKDADLDLAEFKAVFSKWLGKRNEDLDKVDLEEIFKSVDTDNSGRVSVKELVAWLSIYQKGTCHFSSCDRNFHDLVLGSEEDKLNAIFESFDIDHNGTLDKGEVDNVLEVLKFSLSAKGLSESQALANATEKISALVKSNNVVTKEQWLKIGKETSLLEDLLGRDFVQLLN